MDIDWRTEAKRPVTLGLAALALIGWVVAISQISSKSALLASTSAQIGSVTNERQQLATELDQQRRASGTLADLQQKIAGSTVAASTVTQQRDAAAAQLAETTRAVEAAQKGRTEAEAQLKAATEQLTPLRATSAEVETKLTQSRETAAKLDNDIVSRGQELAEISRRIDAARRQETKPASRLRN